MSIDDRGKSGMLGDLIAWDFFDPSFPRGELRELFVRHGFAGIVQDDDRAVGDAILRSRRGAKGETGAARGLVVEPFKRPNKDTPASLGIYLQVGKAGEVGDDFPPGARVRAENGRAVALPPEGQSSGDEKCMKAAQRIADRANAMIANCDSIEMSLALSEAGYQAGWVAYRRKKGGTWFVYEDGTGRRDKFRQLVKAVQARSNGTFVPNITPIACDEDGLNVGNISSAMEYALEGELEDLAKKLEKAKREADTTRDSTVDKRVAECQALVLRANHFRGIIASKADDFAKRIEELKAAFGGLLDAAPTDDGVFSEIDALLKAPKQEKPAPKQAAPKQEKPAPKQAAPKQEKPAPKPKTMESDDVFDVSLKPA